MSLYVHYSLLFLSYFKLQLIYLYKLQVGNSRKQRTDVVVNGCRFYPSIFTFAKIT